MVSDWLMPHNYEIGEQNLNSMTKQEISDLFDRYEDGYQAWRGNGVMTKGAFIEAVTEALRIHDVVGRSEQLVCDHNWTYKILYDHTAADVCTKCGKIEKQI